MKKVLFISVSKIEGNKSAYLWTSKEHALKGVSDEDYDKGMAFDEELNESFTEALGLDKMPVPIIAEIIINYDVNGIKKCPCGNGFITK